MSFSKFVHRQFIYEPPVPTASFKGKTVIVTGSNTGLGLEASRWIVRLEASKVILACRNLEKAKAAADNIRSTTKCGPDIVEVWHLDMSSYASVQAFAEKARTELPRLDAVLANAGMASTKFHITEDDEETITTNVVSTALLGFLLFPKLRETAERSGSQTYLTFTASELYETAKFNERKAPDGQIFAFFNDKKNFKMMDRYDTSKLLDVFIVKQMAALAPLDSNKVIVNCVAPG
jgi:NAD(P)-dependent dehydrogenase (short-subunit alcohol dehydrogenase family)